jgi:SAM-dependent methyltransferase
MTWLLLPGRHHLLTRFQREALERGTGGPLDALRDVQGQPLAGLAPVEGMVWAITSANHSHTRRNPLPAHRREAAIEDFARDLSVPSLVYLIDDIGQSPRFADYIVKKIEVDSRRKLRLTPGNTLVATGTPELADLFGEAGYRVFGMEMASREPLAFQAAGAWQLLEGVCQRRPDGKEWERDEEFIGQVSPASLRTLFKYDYPSLIADLRRQPFLNDDGDITATRDYNVYARAFDEGAARKYALVKDLVRPGRIVDIGCGAGAVLREMAADDRLRESDLYGIEAARPLYAECVHRKQQGAFKNENVFFHQADFAAGLLFPENSLHTVTTFSLTHEIESYLGRSALVRFIELVHRQVAPGGRWLNLDVVGPETPDKIVHLRLAADDGRSDDFESDFPVAEREGHRKYLAGLSTLGKFRRFARDFRALDRFQLKYELQTIGDRVFAVLRLADACEFLSKKDYLDNWRSEMRETFCFWSFADWQRAVEQAGFRVHGASRAFVNPWLVENRYRGKADLFELDGGKLKPLDYPPTNVLVAADKP